MCAMAKVFNYVSVTLTRMIQSVYMHRDKEEALDSSKAHASRKMTDAGMVPLSRTNTVVDKIAGRACALFFVFIPFKPRVYLNCDEETFCVTGFVTMINELQVISESDIIFVFSLVENYSC